MIVILKDAIANEATLTGESVPQMKDALVSSEEDNERRLEIQGRDRMHVLFSGTSIMNTTTMSRLMMRKNQSRLLHHIPKHLTVVVCVTCCVQDFPPLRVR